MSQRAFFGHVSASDETILDAPRWIGKDRAVLTPQAIHRALACLPGTASASLNLPLVPVPERIALLQQVRARASGMRPFPSAGERDAA